MTEPMPPPPSSSPQEAPAAPALLPVFFFHGVLMNAKSGCHFAAKLAREGRHFVPLSFCTGKRSAANSIASQVPLAIAQIREVVDSDRELFANGYVFIGYSQGGLLARAVIEEMNDHHVTTFISLAGAVNGIFHGPQARDVLAAQLFVSGLGPDLIPASVFDFGKFTEDDCHAGTFQQALDDLAREHEVQHQLAFFGLHRSPVKDAWKVSNLLLAELNNVNEAADDEGRANQQRRRNNFLKLQAAHFFASPDDGLVAPWQSSILGQYNELDDPKEITTKFNDEQALHVIDTRATVEYKQDTYGLKTLDKRGGLFLHVLHGVKHISWITDNDEFGPNGGTLRFSEIFDKHLQQLL